MSVTLNSKLVEVGDDSVNLMALDSRSKSHISVWIGAAAVCVGFLLLILILGVVAHNSNAIGNRDSNCVNLVYSLTTDRDTLRDERDQLKIESSNLTKEMEMLQSRYNAMAASRDKLQEEVNQLNGNKTGKPCHEGWKSFGDKCYYFSASGMTKTWEGSRKDCKDRGADLVIISTVEELDFVSKTYSVIWIGLSDMQQENMWKWVDGTELIGDGFWQDGEPNNSDGNEDCAEVSRSAKKFNDVPCTRKFSWACEA